MPTITTSRHDVRVVFNDDTNTWDVEQRPLVAESPGPIFRGAYGPFERVTSFDDFVAVCEYLDSFNIDVHVEI